MAIRACGAIHHVYLDREQLPDLGPFTRFEFPTIGHVYDTNGQALIELAHEYRQITAFKEFCLACCHR
jgi:membrane carboxypeptidase/penicillin-binding protein